MRPFDIPVVIAITVMVTILFIGGLLTRDGLSAIGRPLTPAEDRVLYDVRKGVVALAATERRNPLAGRRDVWREVAGAYQEHCAICHGPAGRGRSTLGAQFYPPPPDLTRPRTQELSDAELYHIIANGIRFTGMPGWSATHGTDELWRYVSFVRALPRLSERELADAAGDDPARAEGRHRH